MAVALSQSCGIRAVQALAYQKVTCSNCNSSTASNSAPLITNSTQNLFPRDALSAYSFLCKLVFTDHWPCLSIIQINCVLFPFPIPSAVSPLSLPPFVPMAKSPIYRIWWWFWLGFCRFSEPCWKKFLIHTDSYLCHYHPSFFGLDSAECVLFSLSLQILKSLPQPPTPFAPPSVTASLQHPNAPIQCHGPAPGVE